MSEIKQHTAYEQLLDKVDLFNERVQAAQGQWLSCHRGCTECCRTQRTAWPVELDYIRKYLAQVPPELLKRLRARRQTPEIRDGAQCIFLAEDGACDVYEVRPVICRTHGPVVRVDEGDLAWCDLNFDTPQAHEVISQLREDSILNLGLLNGMLALINRQFCQEQPNWERAPLETTLDQES